MLDDPRLQESIGRLGRSVHSQGVEAQVMPAEAVVGGGGAPGVGVPSCAIALPPRLARPLRTGTPPIVGRLVHGRLLLDLRCVPETDDELVLTAVVKAADI
ncbi:hypothetical protein ACH41E_18620 [Streptomyces sp. NPDC020412]|uniref:hypothetical protein n=1 Tax=Streptomyces sp. NPDC020412 TaxID=3365073 RepID=UPI0037A99539